MSEARVKKAYQPIVDFLIENENKKVSTILDSVIKLAAAKTGGGGRDSQNVIRDADGNVLAVFCYYHKRYEPVADVEYGKKATSSTGLNSMCKEGTSQWTKQQRAFKSGSEELLQKVMDGELAAEDVKAAREELETERKKIIAREDGIGFETLEEAKEALGIE